MQQINVKLFRLRDKKHFQENNVRTTHDVYVIFQGIMRAICAFFCLSTGRRKKIALFLFVTMRITPKALGIRSWFTSESTTINCLVCSIQIWILKSLLRKVNSPCKKAVWSSYYSNYASKKKIPAWMNACKWILYQECCSYQGKCLHRCGL